MRVDSIVFTVAGMCFGVILGWVLGTQQAGRAAPAAAQQVAAGGGTGTGNAPQQAATLDEARVQSLTTILTSDPDNAGAAVQLANTYFDGERYQDAIKWYEHALKIDPKNVNASTDLGIAYYYLNQPDRALQQFDRSLAIDPRHSKTLLNIGIVRAFGKQDLEGAAKAWQQVIDVAPDSTEARMAKQALQGLRSAHPESGTAPSPQGK